MTRPNRASATTSGTFTADVTGAANDHKFDATFVYVRNYYEDWWELEGHQENVEGDSKRWRNFTFYIKKSIKNGEHEYVESDNFFISYVDVHDQLIIHRFKSGTLLIDFQPEEQNFKMEFQLTATRPHEPEAINFNGSLEVHGIDTSPHSTNAKQPSRSHLARDALLPAPKILEANGSELPLAAVGDGATVSITKTPEMAIGETLYYKIKGRGTIFGTKKISDNNDIIIKAHAFPVYLIGKMVSVDYYIGDHLYESETAEYTVV